MRDVDDAEEELVRAWLVSDPEVCTSRAGRVDVVGALAALRRSSSRQPITSSACGLVDAPGALLLTALEDLGITIAEFSSCGLVGEHQGIHSLRGRADAAEVLTLGAAIALRTADRAQRAGATWVSSVSAAEHSVMALLDIVPTEVLRTATD